MIPQLRDGVLGLGKDADDHAHGHHNQADAEHRVNLADDLIHGQEGCDEIVGQNDNQPEQGGGNHTAGAAILEQGHNQAGRANGKHGAHHNQQHHAEHAHHILHEAAQIDAGDFGDGSAVVPLAHHAGEIVVHAAGKDGAEGDPQEHNGPPQSALQRAEDGAKARDIQKLHKEQLPLRHDHIVNAIVDFHGRRFAVIRAKGVFNDFTIQEIAADQQGQTDQKANHNFSSFT